MEGVRQWAFSVCTAMVACGIAQLVMPKSNMEKMFRVTVSVFFLCCLLSPVVIRSPDLLIQVEEYSREEIEARAAKLTAVVDAQSQSEAKAQVEKIIADKLVKMGIKYRSITININTNGQSGQEIESVDIELDVQHERDHEKILAALRGEMGLKIRLGYG